MAPVDPTSIDAIVNAAEKKYGDKIVHTGAETQLVPRIPYPSIELNVATGGGVPLGRISRWFGNYSSGKSLTAMNVIKNAQNLHIIAEQFLESEYGEVRRRGEELLELFPNGLECAYYNIEKVYDKAFAEAVGVDIDRLHVVEGTIIEKTATILEAMLGAVHLHVIDSASAASSIDEVNSDMEDWHRAIKARVWNKVLDHWQDKLDLRENAIILIDQARTDQMTGAEYAPGGNKLEHNSSQTIHFKRGSWLFNREGVFDKTMPNSGDTIHGGSEADGFEITAVVKKSRVGRPFRKAKLVVNFADMKFDQDHELVQATKWVKGEDGEPIIQKSGSWYTLPDGFQTTNKKGELKSTVQGEGQLAKALREHPKLEKLIRDKVDRHIVHNP